MTRERRKREKEGRARARRSAPWIPPLFCTPDALFGPAAARSGMTRRRRRAEAEEEESWSPPRATNELGFDRQKANPAVVVVDVERRFRGFFLPPLSLLDALLFPLPDADAPRFLRWLSCKLSSLALESERERFDAEASAQ